MADRLTTRYTRRGFTLLECALAMVILGVGVMALIEAQSTFFRANRYSSSAATGAYLANEIRERMRACSKHDPVTWLYFTTVGLETWGPESDETDTADYDDCDDFDALTFGNGGSNPGPIDAAGNVIPQIDETGAVVMVAGSPQPMVGWRQTVTVEKVKPYALQTVVTHQFQELVAAIPREAGDYALRITVVVTYQGPTDSGPVEMARVVWIKT